MNKLFIITLILVLPVVALAQNYVPLVGIPGVDDSDGFGTYINSLYGLSISIAALLAVIKIIIAGVKWMMTDIAPNKSDAKKDIQGALLGLLVILAAVLILTVINPDLGGANIGFEDVDGVTATTVEGEVNANNFADQFAEACATDGCTTISCPLLRWQLTCSGWCEDQNGIFRETFGGALTTNECIVPNSILDTRSCFATGQGQYNCDTRINDCYNEDYQEVSVGGVPSIRCAYSN